MSRAPKCFLVELDGVRGVFDGYVRYSSGSNSGYVLGDGCHGRSPFQIRPEARFKPLARKAA